VRIYPTTFGLAGLLAITLTTLACAPKVWIEDSRLEVGGVIGYQWAKRDGFREKFEAAAKSICGNRGWKVVRDSIKRRDYTYTGTEEQETHVDLYDGKRTTTGTMTTNAPVQKTDTVAWRESVIECGGGVSGVAPGLLSE